MDAEQIKRLIGNWCEELLVGRRGDGSREIFAAIDAMQAQIDSLRKEREDMEGLLLWALWHHQGASSPVGRPIRKFLRMEQHHALLVGQAHHAREVVHEINAALSEESKGTT